MKKIAISGANGFIGRNLCHFLEEHGYKVEKITRLDFSKGPEALAGKISGSDVIINLAGSPVIKRWSRQGKKNILESRISTTRFIGEAVRSSETRPELWINASAIGIYDDQSTHDEMSDRFASGFLADVVSKWESEAEKYHDLVGRLVLLRIGIVLGEEGGVLKRMNWLFKMGLGGYLGNGNQIISFIHIHDLVRAIEFIIQNKNLSGPVNAVAPVAINNREFSRELARMNGWKHLFPVPGLILNAMFGKAASTLLTGQKVVPRKLTEAGFGFGHPEISGALNAFRK